MTGAAEIQKLADMIRKLHHATAKHRESVPVHETFNGQTVWDGTVEVFDLADHPSAQVVFAWSHESDSGGRRYVAVLGAGKVNTPIAAVRAAIVQEYRASKN
jgi:hypothetical protein